MVKKVGHPRKKRERHTPSNEKVLGIKDVLIVPARLLLDPAYFNILAMLLLLGESILNLLVINKVSYTEIDWIAYMQEVKGFIEGERDYSQLRGDTGPLVYPAGFVYIYSALYYLTNKGTNIRGAQYLFGLLYISTQALVFTIYKQSKKIPPYTIVLLCISKRLHSIYVLRCFNDPVAMFFIYACILAMIYKRWTLSSVLYSLGISIKMNGLLFFPAFGIILWKSLGAYKAIGHLFLMAAIQIGLGYPFVSTYPESYLSRAFDFNRVFDYQWTVNWRMIDEKYFVSTEFAKLLLAGHVFVLLLYINFIWCKKEGSMMDAFLRGFQTVGPSLTADEIITMMFTSNLIGITFARSLHYQFYSWYYHTIPYLLWQCKWLTTGRVNFLLHMRIFVLATIEACWLTFPSTDKSSWTLLACHVIVLVGLYGTDIGETYHPPRSIIASQTAS
ncbi:glycosyltransferase [Radiomyces spectabilis]|uniref:glycosyltransferase n=1 Tax=Radiomyces spectabilis TaxID=64574 RepID=UPI00221FF8B1|nr:glycosyltransferase [Radiomyces spectabilis]KAI8369535.1 glycosyltransferase [Radiomyces spectabilis]